MIHKIKQNIKTILVNTDDGQKFPVLKAGNGPAVILIHGFGMDAHAWLPFITPLMGKYCFYLPYLRGFSKSSHLSFTQDDFFAEYANDITSMREQLGIEDCIIGGISMGAMTCMAIHATGNTQGVRKTILIDQSPVIINKPDWQWGLAGQNQQAFLDKLQTLIDISEPYCHLPVNELPKEVITAMMQAIAIMLDHSFNSKSMRLYAQLAEKYPNKLAKYRDTSGWENQRHIIKGYLTQDYDFRQHSHTYKAPVSVIIGNKSRLYHPEGQRAYANMIEQASVIEIDNSGHAVPFDQPFKLFKAMKSVLADC